MPRTRSGAGREPSSISRGTQGPESRSAATKTQPPGWRLLALRSPTQASTTQLERQAERVAVEAGDRGGAIGSERRADASQAVPEILRAPVEDALGVDLSGTRVHTGAAARAQVAGHGSSVTGAFTRGQDIYLGLGSELLSQPENRRLLRHELTHVAQQRAGAGLDEPWMAEAERDFAARDLFDAP